MENDLNEALKYIDPAGCSYQDWINVGMALKHEGYSLSVWDEWSKSDSRYHPGECGRKWDSFNGAMKPVTAGTIVQMAKDRGMNFDGYEIDWDGEILRDDYTIINQNWLENREISEPDNWNPVSEITQFIEALFDVNENIGYCMKSWQDEDGKYKPSDKGNYDRTAGEILRALSECGGDIGSVFGDYNPAGGAWIRVNPLDGKGVRNENVSDFRYVLVESDAQEIERQNSIIRELELPVATLVYSGGKSIHAVVRIDAANYDEYRKRVDYLYDVCAKNGLPIDKQCRNPSRLSRLPGIVRGKKKQFLIDTNIGKKSYSEWREWIEGINDDLPDIENAAAFWDNMPELSPPLIDGVLRQGHKMLIAGPSKAGKSFALIELCCAIAEGREWLSWKCTKGRVMYVNLELDDASCKHRLRDVYNALGWKPENLCNIDIWNLRGKSVPMDKLAPKLIRRALKKSYIAIVIDPIYKVITGDENSADQMAHFCNQFDKVCTELGCAVIYCHHHSKGAQGGKRSMDRASGSGVFARDPDALLDLIELELPEALVREEQNKAACRAVSEYLRANGLLGRLSDDELCSKKAALEACRGFLDNEGYKDIASAANAAEKACEALTAWRIEGTLREFPKFLPLNVWFDYPTHRIDNVGVLKDVQTESERAPWQKATDKRKESAEKTRDKNRVKLENAVALANMGEAPTFDMLAEYLSMPDRTLRDWIKRYGYSINRNDNTVVKIEAAADN